MKHLYSKYYLQLIVFSLLISAVPVIFIGLFSYFSASRMIQKKVDEGNKQILLQTQLRVEQNLKLIENSTLKLLIYRNGITLNNNSVPFNQLIIPNDYETVGNIVNELNNLGVDNIHLEDAALVCMEKDYAISTKGYFKLSDLQEKTQFSKFSSMSQYSFWCKWNGPLISNISPFDNAPLPGIVLVRKMFLMNNLNTNAFAIVKMSGNEMSKFITSSPQLGDVMILDGNFNVIANKDQEMLGRDLSISVYAKKIEELSGTGGQFTANLEDKAVQINYLKSDYNGWIYISTFLKDTDTCLLRQFK